MEPFFQMGLRNFWLHSLNIYQWDINGKLVHLLFHSIITVGLSAATYSHITRHSIFSVLPVKLLKICIVSECCYLFVHTILSRWYLGICVIYKAQVVHDRTDYCRHHRWGRLQLAMSLNSLLSGWKLPIPLLDLKQSRWQIWQSLDQKSCWKLYVIFPFIYSPEKSWHGWGRDRLY